MIALIASRHLMLRRFVKQFPNVRFLKLTDSCILVDAVVTRDVSRFGRYVQPFLMVNGIAMECTDTIPLYVAFAVNMDTGEQIIAGSCDIDRMELYEQQRCFAVSDPLLLSILCEQFKKERHDESGARRFASRGFAKRITLAPRSFGYMLNGFCGVSRKTSGLEAMVIRFEVVPCCMVFDRREDG